MRRIGAFRGWNRKPDLPRVSGEILTPRTHPKTTTILTRFLPVFIVPIFRGKTKSARLVSIEYTYGYIYFRNALIFFIFCWLHLLLFFHNLNTFGVRHYN